MTITLLHLWRRCKTDEADPDACWLWRGGINQRGYPIVYAGGKARVSARRTAWQLWNGRPIGRGMYCSPVCGVARCINPEHMELLTRAGYCAGRKGRARRADHVSRTTLARRRRAKLTLEAVRAIRADTGRDQRELAADFGVSRSTISQIQKHQIWREPSPWPWTL